MKEFFKVFWESITGVFNWASGDSYKVDVVSSLLKRNKDLENRLVQALIDLKYYKNQYYTMVYLCALILVIVLAALVVQK